MRLEDAMFKKQSTAKIIKMKDAEQEHIEAPCPAADDLRAAGSLQRPRECAGLDPDFQVPFQPQLSFKSMSCALRSKAEAKSH